MTNLTDIFNLMKPNNWFWYTGENWSNFLFIALLWGCISKLIPLHAKAQWLPFYSTSPCILQADTQAATQRLLLINRVDAKGNLDSRLHKRMILKLVRIEAIFKSAVWYSTVNLSVVKGYQVQDWSSDICSWLVFCSVARNQNGAICLVFLISPTSLHCCIPIDLINLMLAYKATSPPHNGNGEILHLNPLNPQE